MKVKAFRIETPGDVITVATTFVFTVNCSQKGVLDIDILDKQGRSYKQTSQELSEGKSEIELDVSALKQGEYNVWFNFKDQTLIKRLKIARQTRQSAWKILFS